MTTKHRTEWRHIFTFPQKMRNIYAALVYMITHGGIAFRLLLLVGIPLIITAVGYGVPIHGVVLLVLTLLLCAGLEIANTIFEILLDIIHPSHSVGIKHLKDLSGILPAMAMTAHIVVWLYFMFGV